jgi:integrase
MTQSKSEQKDGFQKRGKFWSYRYRVPDPLTGKKKEVRVSGFLTKEEAKADRAVKVVEAENGKFVKRSTLTVAEHFEEWLEFRIASGKIKLSAIGQYRYILNHYILPKFGVIALRDLNAQLIQSTLIQLAKSGKKDGGALSKSSLRIIGLTLSQGLNRAVTQKRISSSPMNEVEIPSGHSKKVEALSMDYIKALLTTTEKIDHRLRALFYLAINTGARRGELCALRWSDFNPSEGEITISKTRGMVNGEILEFDSTKSKRGMRTIQLDQETVIQLLAHKAREGLERDLIGEGWRETGYIFTQENGDPIYPTTPSALFKTLAKRAGLSPAPFHALRHTHATELLRSGRPAYLVAERLGDTVQTVLDTYAHANKEDGRKSAETFAEIVQSA